MDYDFAVWPPMITGLVMVLLMNLTRLPIIPRIVLALLLPLLYSGCGNDTPAPPPETAQRLTTYATNGVCRWCAVGICTTEECIP